MNSALIRLFLRRTVSIPRCIGFALALLALAYISTPADWVLRAVDDPRLARRSFALQTVWSGALWLLLPLLLLHAAHLPTRWRANEREWINSRPGARMRIIPSAWLGTWIGALLLVIATGVAAECSAGPAPDSVLWADAGSQSGPARGIVPATGVRWTLELPADAEVVRARLSLGLAPGDGPFATARWRAYRTDAAAQGDGETSVEAVLTSRTQLELELPPGEGPVECELIRVGAGANLLVRFPRTEFFVHAKTALQTSLILGLRLLIALAAWIALAIGFGSWLGSGYAFGLLVSVWIGFWLRASTPAWLPGRDLPEVLARMHEGRVPMAPAAAVWLGGLGCIAFGGALAWARARYERGRT